MPGVEIVPLTPDVWPAISDLFRQGGDPRWCWCQYWRMRARDFSAARVPELRSRLAALAAGPRAPGLVALMGERAVGWLGAGPRGDFERLERSRVIPKVDEGPVWSIVCFAVARDARGEGLAARLLEAASVWASDHGAELLEAYPVAAPRGVTLSPEAAFTGTLDMFERSGFRRVAETGSMAGGFPRVVVRRPLRHLRHLSR